MNDNERNDLMRLAIGYITALDEVAGPNATYTEADFGVAVSALLNGDNVEVVGLTSSLAAVAMLALDYASQLYGQLQPHEPKTARDLLAHLATQLSK